MGPPILGQDGPLAGKAQRQLLGIRQMTDPNRQDGSEGSISTSFSKRAGTGKNPGKRNVEKLVKVGILQQVGEASYGKTPVAS